MYSREMEGWLLGVVAVSETTTIRGRRWWWKGRKGGERGKGEGDSSHFSTTPSLLSLLSPDLARFKAVKGQL
jgi:hypothetical protein